MKILFLDDSIHRTAAFARATPNDEVTLTQTAQATIEALTNEVFDEVWLDHDLGGQVYQSSDREDCGMEVVRWIIRNLPPINKIVVHSWNIPAAKQMRDMLWRAGYRVIQVPFQADLLDR